MNTNTHTLENKHGKIEVLEQGAHLSSWICGGKEQLFVSDKAIYREGTALRGGVPICFPQFAAFGSGQKHGFVRNHSWQLSQKNDDALVFECHSSAKTQHLWPFDFALKFTVSLRQDTLNMQLIVENTGNKAFDFGAALHTYFRCDDVNNIQVTGLQKTTCWDNGTPFDQRYEDNQPGIGVNGPLDRVYFAAPDTVTLEEGSTSRQISKTGFHDIVVWNPWLDGAQGLADMADDEYLKMICIEAAIVDKQIHLPAGQSWTGEQIISVRSE